MYLTTLESLRVENGKDGPQFFSGGKQWLLSKFIPNLTSLDHCIESTRLRVDSGCEFVVAVLVLVVFLVVLLLKICLKI